jgi:pilus assembly protein FimV
VKESVVRNLTRSIAAMSLMVPAYAYPLGIGEIKLHSALNQKLDAEIALQLSSGENFSDIRVKIAPPEKYDELGVPWNYFLSQIVFETAIDAQGRSIVKLKSKEPLREPFLDLVLEVAWDKGSLFREFTVLVDPPAAYDRPIVQVVSAPTEPKVETPESANVKESTPNLANEQYGPTTRLDTLWKITEKLNQDPEISTEQFLIALYNANQSAFYQPNVNALMADQFLTIPPKSDILQLSPGQALAEFRKQDSAWSPAASKSTVQKSIPDAEVNAQLELQAPLTDEVDQSKILVASDSAETTSSDQDFDQDDGLAVSDASLALQSRIEKL